MTGTDNVAVGFNALAGLGTGSYNTAVGSGAGRYIAGGTAFARNVSHSIFIGTEARPLNADDTNTIVIGHYTNGIGANTVAIGNFLVTRTRLRGVVETNNDFESITAGSGVILKSPNGTRYRITVDDSGAIKATAVT